MQLISAEYEIRTSKEDAYLIAKSMHLVLKRVIKEFYSTLPSGQERFFSEEKDRLRIMQFYFDISGFGMTSRALLNEFMQDFK